MFFSYLWEHFRFNCWWKDLHSLFHVWCLQVSQKELKEALRRQWSQLSDKKRLKWISKALELQKHFEVYLCVLTEAKGMKYLSIKGIKDIVNLWNIAFSYRTAWEHIMKLIRMQTPRNTSNLSWPRLNGSSRTSLMAGQPNHHRMFQTIKKHLFCMGYAVLSYQSLVYYTKIYCC